MVACRFDYIPRTRYRTDPATVQINNRLMDGKGPAFRLTKAWWEFVLALNTPDAARFVVSPKSGWVNEGFKEDRPPLVQSLTMGGNVAVVHELRGKFARLSTFTNEQSPPDPAEYNFQKTPWLVHRFTCVTRRGEPRNPGAGIIAYFPLIVKGGDAWVPIAKIELFNAMPDPIMPDDPPALKEGYEVVVVRAYWIRTGPNGNKVRIATPGESFWIGRVSRGWGEIGAQRWIELNAVVPT